MVFEVAVTDICGFLGEVFSPKGFGGMDAPLVVTFGCADDLRLPILCVGIVGGCLDESLKVAFCSTSYIQELVVVPVLDCAKESVFVDDPHVDAFRVVGYGVSHPSLREGGVKPLMVCRYSAGSVFYCPYGVGQ